MSEAASPKADNPTIESVLRAAGLRTTGLFGGLG